MYAPMRLAAKAQDSCIGGIDPGHFHTVHAAVRGNPLKDELPCVCVLALVPFQGDLQKMESRIHDQHEQDEQRETKAQDSGRVQVTGSF